MIIRSVRHRGLLRLIEDDDSREQVSGNTVDSAVFATELPIDDVGGPPGAGPSAGLMIGRSGRSGSHGEDRRLRECIPTPRGPSPNRQGKGNFSKGGASGVRGALISVNPPLRGFSGPPPWLSAFGLAQRERALVNPAPDNRGSIQEADARGCRSLYHY